MTNKIKELLQQVRTEIEQQTDWREVCDIEGELLKLSDLAWNRELQLNTEGE